MGNESSSSVVCACEAQMHKVKACDAYPNGSGLICDECGARIKGDVLVYHCDKNSFHKNGYDVCLNCVAKSPNKRKSIMNNNNNNNDNDEKESVEELIQMIRILRLLAVAAAIKKDDNDEEDEKDEMKNIATISPQKQLRRYNCDSIVLTYFYGKNKYYFYAARDVYNKGFFKRAYRAVLFKSELTTNSKIATPRIADGTNVVLKQKYRKLNGLGFGFQDIGPIMLREEWNEDLNELERLDKYCQEWNKKKYSDKTYEVSKASVLKVSDLGISGTGQFVKGEYLLVEPFMPEFEKWNWPTASEKYAKAFSIQAFGHFTYHHSNGEQLVNDAQGYRDNDRYIITDPFYVPGNDARCKQWFNDHECNKFCKSWWKRPQNVEKKQLKGGFCYSSHNGNNNRCIRPTSN